MSDGTAASRAGGGGDFTLRTAPRFNDGAYLVANAIRDAVLVFRGSSCVYEDLFAGFFDHDAAQTLLTDFSDRRIIDTTEPYTRSVAGAEDKIDQIAKWKPALRGRKLILLTELSRIALMGEDIRLGAKAMERATGLPCVPATARWIVRDYTDSVESLLAGMAQLALTTTRAAVRPGTVGIVGYLCARNEGDALGDVAELERLVRGIGLEPLPVWLSGATWSDMLQLPGSERLVALPDGAPAARKVSESTGAPVLDLPLPVSLGQTREWVESIAAAAGREADARAFIESEARRVAPTLDIFVRRYLMGRRAAVVATREWLPGIVRCLEEDLGIQVVCALQRNRKQVGDESSDENALDRTFDPSEASLGHHLREAVRGGALDLMIGSAWERTLLPAEHKAVPFLEFGFPQLTAHFLLPTPHVGFSGVLTWAQRIHDVLAAGNRRAG